MKDQQSTMNRRQFVSGLAAASAFTIVPRRVFPGAGFRQPSDMIVVAQVGAGTQAQRQVNIGMVERPDLQFVAVVDPVSDNQNYVDWGEWGNRSRIRRFLNNENWGANDKGIRAGREVAKQIMETYYAQNNRPATGIRTYEDYREMLEQESDVDVVVSITPDHQHAAIAMAAMKAGKSIVSHKPVSNVMSEVRRTVRMARDTPGVVTHLLAYSDNEDYYTLGAWLNGGAIGTVREVHNWTARPYWPQGALNYPTERPPVPAGFNWELWQGPEQDRPYHPALTHAVYRGWYAYGGGSMADMGNYSLWQPYRLMNLGVPTSIEGRANTVSYLNPDNTSDHGLSQVSFPHAGRVQFRVSSPRGPVDVFWYEGGVVPQTPRELYDAGEVLDNEGMMFVGDDGVILAAYRGSNPRLLPESRARAAADIRVDTPEVVGGDDEWTNAIKNGTKSKGSFENIAALAEATALNGIAYRMSGERLNWDSNRMAFTGDTEANQLVNRQYRRGWEQLFA